MVLVYKKIIMIKIIKHAPENVAAFLAKGTVSKKDFEKVFKHVQKKIKEHGELNYLLKLETEPSNFTAGAWINDFLLGLKNLSEWNRCAIVTDNDIVHKVTAASDFVTIGDFKAFEKDEYCKALHWTSTGETKLPKQTGTALLAGLGGAIALNVIHELVRHNYDNDDVPEVNKIGEEAVEKIANSLNIELDENQKYSTALAGDLISNALYYAGTAANNFGGLAGIVAGIGAVELPKYLGLNDDPVKRNKNKEILTIAFYTLGGVATSLLYNKLKNKK